MSDDGRLESLAAAALSGTPIDWAAAEADGPVFTLALPVRPVWICIWAAGTDSPGPSSHAIVFPTAMSSPTLALMPASTPSPGDSTSTTALSVSMSSSNSPFRTCSPSCFRHATTLPVSCASSRAGITTLVGTTYTCTPSPFALASII